MQLKHNKTMQPAKLLLYGAGVIACAGIPFTANAVEEAPPAASPPVESAPAESPPAESASRPLYRPLTLGLEAGTTGGGGSVSWRFIDHLGVRAGFDYFELSESSKGVGGFLHYNVTERLMSEPLTLDIYPWKKYAWHVSVGVLFNQNQVTGSVSDSGTVIIDGQPFAATSLRTLNLQVEQELVNPYLGIGGNFFYFDHAHHWAMGGELGVAYTGDAKVTLTGSGRLAPVLAAAVGREQSRAQNYANGYQWWPVLKLMVTYSF